MQRYVIERDFPGVGDLGPVELGNIAEKSNTVLAAMAPRVQWVQSYVTDDRIYCVYLAEDDTAVRDHARQGGFPANRVSQVAHMIDPTSGGEAS